MGAPRRAATRAVSVVSIALLVHAGFSTIHLKGVDPDAKLPPTDVVLEVLAAFLLATLSALALLPDLKPVRVAAALSPDHADAAFHCPDFAVVHHRGRSIAARLRARKTLARDDLD